jgi:hypothetical protein
LLARTLALALALPVFAATAADITVTTLQVGSGGPGCSLRDAITAAETDAATGDCAAGNLVDVIRFQSGLAGTITLGSPLPVLGASGQAVEVIGPGADRLAVSGDHDHVVFATAGFPRKRIARITIRAGNDHCVLADGPVSIEDARVTDCGGGAALDTGDAGGFLHVERTLVDHNDAYAIRVGGITGSGFVEVVNSTIAWNDGGIYVQNADGPGSRHTVFASTLAHNGVANLFIAFDQQIEIDHVLLIAADAAPNCILGGVSQPYPNLTSSYSIADDASCDLAGAGDEEVLDALAGPLADNGGPTDTIALLDGSPAIDGGAASCDGPDDVLTADQRGSPRPSGAACDVGAFEAPEPGATLTGVSAAAALSALRRRRAAPRLA